MKGTGTVATAVHRAVEGGVKITNGSDRGELAQRGGATMMVPCSLKPWRKPTAVMVSSTRKFLCEAIFATQVRTRPLAYKFPSCAPTF